MKKRFFKIIAAFLVIALLLPEQIGEVKADTVEENGITYEFDDSTGTLTVSGKGTVSGMEEWENYKSSVKKLLIEDGITEIGDSAFSDCSKLTTLVLSEGLETIGQNAFYGCVELRELEIPSKVTIIKDNAFNGCIKMESLTLPDGLETIGDFAFCCDYEVHDGYYSYNSVFKELYIPSTVKIIGSKAFRGFRRMTNLILPEGLEEIGDFAFSLCDDLEELEVPSTVKTIDSGAFFYCLNLTQISLPEGLEKMGSSVFASSENVQKVILPGTLSEMGSSAFHKNTLLLCNNAYQVQYCEKNGYAYGDISNGLEINDTIVSFPESTFPGHGVYGFVYTGSEIRPKMTLGYKFANGGYDTLEENVDYTVSYANNIEYGTATITITGMGMYKGEKLVDFYIYKPAGTWDVSLEYESVVYDGTEKTPAVTVQMGEITLVKGKDYEIQYENNVDEGLATVTITGKGGYIVTVTKTFIIYKKELKDCTITPEYTETLYDGSVKKPAITVRDKEGNLLKESIDYQLIYSGNTLYGNYLINPGTVTVKVQGIGSYKGEKGITYIIRAISIEHAEVTLEKTTFTYNGSEQHPQVTVKLGGKVLSRFVDYTLTYKNNIEVGTAQAIIRGVGNYTGEIYRTFTIVPYDGSSDSVQKNPDSVQEEKTTLTSKNLTYTITNQDNLEVEVVAASEKNISKLVIPATITADGKKYKVTSVGERAFYKNTKIKSIVIGNNVTTIKDYAFYGCKNAKTVKIGKSIKLLGASSFGSCKKLKTITINANRVVNISNNAIKGISKKAVIKVPKKFVKKYKKKVKSKTGFKKTMKIRKK